MLGNGWNISKTRGKIIVKHEKFFQHRKQKKKSVFEHGEKWEIGGGNRQTENYRALYS